MDVIQAEPSNLLYPQTAEQHLSPEGPQSLFLHFTIISAHEEYGCDMKYSTLLSDLFATLSSGITSAV